MMVRAFYKALLASVLAFALTAGTALAQQTDVRDLADRIDRLERDLNILQSQFYRSQSGSATVPGPTPPAARGRPAAICPPMSTTPSTSASARSKTRFGQ